VDDLHAQLLAAFEIEHREHLEAIRSALQGGAPVDVREVFRRAHSLKGAARAVDLPAIEALAHRLEAVLAKALDGELALDGPVADAIQLSLDAIEAQAEAVRSKSAPPAIEAVLAALDQAGRGGALGEASASPSEASSHAAAAEDQALEYVRIEAGALLALSRSVHELSADLQEQEHSLAAVRRLQADVRRLSRTWAAARGHLHDSPKAGLARDIDESLRIMRNDIADLNVRQGRSAWSTDQSLRRLRGGVEQISLTPAEAVFGGLPRMARDLAREAGAEADVRVEGLGVQADRRVLQGLKDALTHLIRNAVSHGLEPAEVRRAAGKPARLVIEIKLLARHGRLEISVSDDGPGPDPHEIEARAVAAGLLPARGPGDAAPSGDELFSLVFVAGFSTANQINEISGRGMGLSVVAEAVGRLRGSARLTRRAPYGATVTLSVPFSTARQTLVLVDCGADAFAIPSFEVRRLLHLPAERLETVDGHPAARIAVGPLDVMAPVVSLSALLGRSGGSVAIQGGIVKAVLVARGERHLALAVEAFRDVREAVVVDLESDLLDMQVTAGAVLLEDEVPALVLKGEALVERWTREERRLASQGLGLAAQVEPQAPARTILVVDDSITTRTLEKSILEAQGYQVRLAVDGLDALALLQSGASIIDLVVADIEMPRMDGFSLLQAIKSDASLASLPVVLMTSRADPLDVRRGLELGAEAYLTKQKFDQRELLATIGRLL
jgi:two-component system chemotaxis sensor kinase CheA